ncbi:early transcribed membrane protein 10.3 (ETRAMP10.3) [Plasmodium ovale wallikeri]|uniref:Early transcribed membrane protein 10.3 (ETRAMP10.3) n=2 Tax=Plasmodium ovale TaxID=36330 RepID=A0A1A8YMK8_PLAOA|nr:early transcribed membrane protein 10.3 (ETRAMP10.3) [Plasmodium ovale wallikeri]SBT56145.1 early transcribed membrane protein 10.3 (ETRAMP10.3) [Plasmodium ovale wallikeri]SBT76002.1 early transcribed membrane protein [Plasmodium ovale]
MKITKFSILFVALLLIISLFECRESVDQKESKKLSEAKELDARLKSLMRKKKLVIASIAVATALTIFGIVGGVSYGLMRHKRNEKKNLEESFTELVNPVRAVSVDEGVPSEDVKKYKTIITTDTVTGSVSSVPGKVSDVIASESEQGVADFEESYVDVTDVETGEPQSLIPDSTDTLIPNLAPPPSFQDSGPPALYPEVMQASLLPEMLPSPLFPEVITATEKPEEVFPEMIIEEIEPITSGDTSPYYTPDDENGGVIIEDDFSDA